MRFVKPQYIIRNRDDPGLTSPSMTYEKVIKAAKSGDWGDNCLIDEVYVFMRNFPAVLRRVASFSKDSGFTIIETDEEYSCFLAHNEVDEPKSPALNELRAVFLNTA